MASWQLHLQVQQQHEPNSYLTQLQCFEVSRSHLCVWSNKNCQNDSLTKAAASCRLKADAYQPG
jgi:hypothetical protein